MFAMIRICLAGLTGSGKTSIGEELAKELNIEHVHKSFKDAVKDEKELLKMQRNVKEDYEKAFDKEIVRLAKGKNCVVTTWLGAWFIKDATLRVWLNASKETRIKRLMKKYKESRKYIERYITEKDNSNVKRWKKIYNIDLNDHSIFDLEINTEKFTPREIVSIIAMVALAKDKKRFA